MFFVAIHGMMHLYILSTEVFVLWINFLRSKGGWWLRILWKKVLGWCLLWVVYSLAKILIYPARGSMFPLAWHFLTHGNEVSHLFSSKYTSCEHACIQVLTMLALCRFIKLCNVKMNFLTPLALTVTIMKFLFTPSLLVHTFEWWEQGKQSPRRRCLDI